jgi:hypothetical protein
VYKILGMSSCTVRSCAADAFASCTHFAPVAAYTNPRSATASEHNEQSAGPEAAQWMRT